MMDRRFPVRTERMHNRSAVASEIFRSVLYAPRSKMRMVISIFLFKFLVSFDNTEKQGTVAVTTSITFAPMLSSMKNKVVFTS